MFQSRGLPLIASMVCSGLVALGAAQAQIVEGYDLSKMPPPIKEKIRVNAGAVSILVSGSTCTCARFTEDIRNVVNDVNNPRPGGVRMVPVLGQGGIQNLKDTLFLRGINMSIVDESTLKVLKESDPAAYGDIEQRLRFITKLYNAELHILTRKETTSLADLSGKIVNFDYKDSETDLVASRVFKRLGVKPQVTYDDQRYALKRLVSGEIAAVVVSTGAPQDILTRLRSEDGLHFLPINETSAPGKDLGPLMDEFLPSELTTEQYPNLIAPGQSIPTVASRVILAIYNWPSDNVRYIRNAKFVTEFFNRIDEFRNPARHPKWKDVNLAADVPGWTRFAPAQDWLDSHAAGSSITQTSSDLTGQRQAFEAFIAKRESGSNAPITDGEREALFGEFQRFLETQEKQ
jgi:TRAP-type uncharacterized transport system substrate-binding protein